jgi:hypothetical protein
MTSRQEIRQFSFQVGPIGMEVEILNDKLTCTGVIPDSQAGFTFNVNNNIIRLLNLQYSLL